MSEARLIFKELAIVKIEVPLWLNNLSKRCTETVSFNSRPGHQNIKEATFFYEKAK